MNRRQFLSLLPAAAVAGTATAAAPKSLSLEEGLLSAWRISPFSVTSEGQIKLRYLDNKKLRALTMTAETRTHITYEVAEDELYLISNQIRQVLKSGVDSLKPLRMQTEQGLMRLCPHSLRWFPYSPKTDAI